MGEKSVRDEQRIVRILACSRFKVHAASAQPAAKPRDNRADPAGMYRRLKLQGWPNTVRFQKHHKNPENNLLKILKRIYLSWDVLVCFCLC